MGKIIFCEKCGKIMDLKENNIMKCAGCGFEKDMQGQVQTFSEKIQKKYVGEGVVLEEKQTKSGFKHECKKCGHGECDIYSIGAPYGDESDIVFYKCRNCKSVERYAQGSSNN